MVALLAAGGAVPAAAAAAPSSAVGELPVARVPSDIAKDCSRDVTVQLNQWIGSVSDGSELQFARRGCYRVDGTILISDRSRLVIDGRGSTFKAVAKGGPNRKHFHLVDDRDITLRNLTVRGVNPDAGASADAYVPEFEQQHAFELRGTQGATLERVRAFDVHGDFVYIGNTENGPSRDTRVVRSVFERSGRQGIAVTDGEGIVIEGNRIGEVPQAIFDLEPNIDTAGARRVRIADNTTGDAQFWFSSEGVGYNIGDVTITDNEMDVATRTLLRMLGPAGGYRGPLTIIGNEFKIDPAAADLGVGAAFTFAHCRNVTIRKNVAQFPDGTNMPVVRENDAKRLIVRDNKFPGARQLIVSV